MYLVYNTHPYNLGWKVIYTKIYFTVSYPLFNILTQVLIPQCLIGVDKSEKKDRLQNKEIWYL